MAKYHQVGDDYEYPTMKGRYKTACCDCGLVHYMQFEIVRVTDETAPYENDEIITDPQLRVRLKTSRNNRASGQIRRHIRFTNRRKFHHRGAMAYHLAFMESWLYGNNPIKRRVKGWTRIHAAK
jgi:hypothetical protein